MRSQLSTTVSGVCKIIREAGPDLRLLKAVEETVTALAKLQSQMDGLRVIVDGLIEGLGECDIDGALDPQDVISDAMLDAEAKLREQLTELECGRQAGVEDPALRGEHEDAVISEYDLAIDATKALWASCQKLRWEVLERDADFEQPTEEAFASPDDLLKRLHG